MKPKLKELICDRRENQSSNWSLCSYL